MKLYSFFDFLEINSIGFAKFADSITNVKFV